MTTAYTPLASSLAARAVAHLQTLEPGTVLATAPLAEALGVDSAAFAASVSVAVRYGLLKQQVRERRSYWSLGDGVSLPVPDDDEPLVQRVVEANGASLPDVPRWPGLDIDAAPITLGRPKRGPKPCAKTAHPSPTTPPPVVASPYKPPTAGIRCALWSDGQLQVQRGVAEVILFSAEETRHLVHYLERMAEGAE